MFRTPYIRALTGFLGLITASALVAGVMPGTALAAGGPAPGSREAVGLGGGLPRIVPTATMEEPSTIDGRAQDLQFSRDGSKAYAVGGSRFSIIDVASDTVAESVEVYGVGQDMVISPDESTAFFSDYDYARVTFVDIATMRVTGTVPLDTVGGHLAVSADGSTLYAAVDATPSDTLELDSVAVIDVASRSVDAVIPVGWGPGRPLVTGGKVYVPNTYDETVSIINAATNTLIKTMPAPGLQTGPLSVDKSRIYYPSCKEPTPQECGLSIISVATDTVLGTIKTTSPPSVPVFAPNGTTAYVVDQEPGRYVNNRYEPGAYFVARVDLVNNTATALKDSYSGRAKPALQISPDGSRLYIVGGYALVLALPSHKIVASTYMADNQVSSFQLEPRGTKGYGTTIDRGAVVLHAPVMEHVRKDYNSDGATDVLARDANGVLWLYPGNANKDWLPRKQVGSGWNAMNLITTPGDFNGDGNPDVLARDSIGDLWLYPGDGNSDWLPRSKVGVGWNAMTALVTPGDFNFDGKADALARDAAGDLWLYPGNGAGGWLPRAKLGAGWNEMTTILGPGNTSDPGNDILGRDQAGVLWRYQRTNDGQWLNRGLVGVGWNVMTAMVTPGDLDGDDLPDILARDSAGDLWLYPGIEYGGYDPRTRVGVGWNVMTAIM